MADPDPSLLDEYTRRMRAADATNLSEVAIRLGIVATCGLAVFLVMDDALLILWISVYWLTTIGYVLWLRREVAPIPAWRYWSLLAFHVFIALWFAAMPVYIATFGDTMSLFIGYSGVCGLAMHNITRRSTTPHVAWSDVGTVMVAATIVGWQFVLAVPDRAMSGAIAVVTLSLIGYYVHTFIDTGRVRDRLQQKAAQERQTQKMQAVGQLTAGIAHDFNNILTVIRGNLELHDALDDPKDRRDVLREARDASEKAAHLVAQLLAFSRKSKINPKPRSAAETLDEFLGLARRTLPATTRIEIAKPLPDIDIIADPTLLQSALLNAALNARDAMGPGGGVLTVRVTTSTEPPSGAGAQGVEARLTLTDSGPGVAPNQLEKLTEPFYTSKPVGQGSGLGLSMIKGFAEQSGGALELANAPEGGLSLTISLPAEWR